MRSSNVTDVRAATIVDFVYANYIASISRSTAMLPMEHTWLFIGFARAESWLLL